MVCICCKNMLATKWFGNFGMEKLFTGWWSWFKNFKYVSIPVTSLSLFFCLIISVSSRSYKLVDSANYIVAIECLVSRCFLAFLSLTLSFSLRLAFLPPIQCGIEHSKLWKRIACQLIPYLQPWMGALEENIRMHKTARELCLWAFKSTSFPSARAL